MDIDKLLVNVERNVNCQILMRKIMAFNNAAEIEYVKGVVTEYVLYLCEQHLDDFTENVLKISEFLKHLIIYHQKIQALCLNVSGILTA